MEFYKRAVIMAGVMAVGVYSAPQRGNNEYLPPDQGYNYPKPSVPFNTQGPISSPAPRPPTTSYQPPPPPAAPYQPPKQQYNPPPPTQAPYRPPQQTPYQPPPAPYQPPKQQYVPPPPTQAPYRPPQQTQYNPPPPTQAPYKPPTQSYGPPPPAVQPPYQPPRQQDNGQDGSHDHSSHHGADHVHEAGMPYDFNYAVKDDQYGTDFSQNEVSDGDKVTGEYRVQLPDGRLQIVRYTADWKTGFHADVTYEGEARYPEPAPYKPPQQPLRPAASNQQDTGYNYPSPTQANPSSQYGPPKTGY